MSARVFVHPQLMRRASFCDIVRYFESLGRSLCNTPANNLEAKPTERSVKGTLISRLLGKQQ
jgi:hypothetical protein